MPSQAFTVAPDAPPQLDRFLAKVLPGVPLERARKLLAEGRVKVNGKLARPNRRLWGGETVEVDTPAPRVLPKMEGASLEVLYEDARLVIINKPPGTVVEPDGSNPSLVELLASQRKGFHTRGQAAPGVVHRLDKDTSGCVMLAKNDAAAAELGAAFQDKRIEKTYLALVLGEPPETQALDTPFGRDPRDPRRFSTRVTSARRARLSFRTLERFPGAALVEVNLDTGRTHQIRVQLSDAGFPVLGDSFYGPKEARAHAAAEAIGRIALHAARLKIALDPPVAIEAPLPEDFRRGLELLRGGAMSRAP